MITNGILLKNKIFHKVEKYLFYLLIITESKDPQVYWRKLKQRLKEEGNETVTNCHGLKLRAAGGKMRLTDVADTEQIFRIIQSIPSPKAEPFKQKYCNALFFNFSNVEEFVPVWCFDKCKEDLWFYIQFYFLVIFFRVIFTFEYLRNFRCHIAMYNHCVHFFAMFKAKFSNR